MNIKLSYNIRFSAVVVDGLQIFPNTYTVKLNMLTGTENRTHQNVALHRVAFFVNEIFNQSLLISINNPIVTKLSKLIKDSQIIKLPDDPYDQIIGMILFDKLSAIAEEKLLFESILIGSHITPELFYTVDDFEIFELENVEKPWWERSDLTVTDDPKLLTDTNTWKDLNLDWDANNDDDKKIEFMLELEDGTIPPDVVVLDGGK